MTRPFARSVVLSIVCTLIGTVTPAIGQVTTARNDQVPRMPDGKPNMTGVWAGPGFRFVEGKKYPEIVIGAGGIAKNLPPFVPGGEELFNLKKTGDVKHDNPQLLCYPHGMPRVALSAHAQQFIQGPTHLAILYENDHMYRAIPLDGRPHSKELDPWGVGGTYMGNAVGHWEGDTLVVDTIGLKAWWLDAQDHMHSDALHLIERFTMTSATKATYELTIDDPKIFTRPFTHSWEMRLVPDWELEEFVCEDNNKDIDLIQFLNKK